MPTACTMHNLSRAHELMMRSENRCISVGAGTTHAVRALSWASRHERRGRHNGHQVHHRSWIRIKYLSNVAKLGCVLVSCVSLAHKQTVLSWLALLRSIEWARLWESSSLLCISCRVLCALGCRVKYKCTWNIVQHRLSCGLCSGSRLSLRLWALVILSVCVSK